jgi:hypothetical protein
LQVPLISGQPTIHRETVMNKNDFISALESKVNAIVQKQLDGEFTVDTLVDDVAILAWILVILTKQRRYDFRPKDAEIATLAASVATTVRSRDH